MLNPSHPSANWANCTWSDPNANAQVLSWGRKRFNAGIKIRLDMRNNTNWLLYTTHCLVSPK